MAMIETRQAIENLDEILATPGLDSVYVGPSDLSVSMGQSAGFDPEFPEVLGAILKIPAAAKNHGVIPGIHVGSVAYAKRMFNPGYRLVSYLTDFRFLQWSSRAASRPCARACPPPARPDGRVGRWARPRATAIGAGIVGICCASYLQREGFEVEVVDFVEPDTQCCYGNAGGVYPGSRVPITMPGMLKKVPGSLADPEGPLYIRLAYLAQALPWILRFLAAGREDRVRRISNHVRALHRLTVKCYEPLLKEAGCSDLIEHQGQLFVYEDPASLEGEGLGLSLRRERGVRSRS
jgi:hypothetical protein